MKTVTAVVVTYNRLNLLMECIDALKSQTYNLSHIVIVNNASTDGTEEYLNKLRDSKVIIFNSTKNLGGAGGFSKGIRVALQETNDDFIWIMDDDTIPTSSALQAMIAVGARNPKFGFICSEVRGLDDTTMNLPVPVRDWNNDLRDGVVKVDEASFVSLLIRSQVVRKVGLPFAKFFIWFDDAEYTNRISRVYSSYYASNSIVIHKAKSSKGPDIVLDTRRLKRYIYFYRNGYFYFKQRFGALGSLKFFALSLKDMYRVLMSSDKKIMKIMIIIRGLVRGILFRPKVEFSGDERLNDVEQRG